MTKGLAGGAAMRRVTDHQGTSREMLAYVVDSTAAPVSVIIPISTWAVFFGGLLVENGLAADGQGVKAYIEAIPYMFYAWAAVLIVPLVIAGVIPVIGPMRKAEARAAAGQTVPPGAERVEAANQAILPHPEAKSRSWDFVLPVAFLALATWWFDYDFLRGLYLTLFLYIAMIALTRTLGAEDILVAALDGFKTMIAPLAVLVLAYMLNEVNTYLGLSEYVIDTVAPWLTPETLPLAVFVFMGLLSFGTGSNWGVFVIVLPIVATLAQLLDANIPLVVGATLSASTFGSHACFYTDATVLTAQACGTTPYQHAITQIPYALMAAVLAAAGFWLVA